MNRRLGWMLAMLLAVRAYDPAGSLRACTVDEDCADYFNCDYSASRGSASLCVLAPTSGHCAAAPHRWLCGRASSGTEYWCDAQNNCRPQGGNCDPNNPDSCGLNQWCPPGGLACQPRSRNPGDTCDPLNPDSCALDLWCSAGSRSCQRRGAEGEVCEVANLDSCHLDLWCSAGRCRKPGQQGQGCDVTVPYSCGWGLVCASGLCRPAAACDPAQTEACDPGLYCVGAACGNNMNGPSCRGFCKGPSGLWGDCDPKVANSCGSGLYCTPTYYCARVIANRDARGGSFKGVGLMSAIKGVTAADLPSSPTAGPGGNNTGSTGTSGATGGFGGSGDENQNCVGSSGCKPGLFCADPLCYGTNSSGNLEGVSDRNEVPCDAAHPLRDWCGSGTNSCRCQKQVREGQSCLPLTCFDDEFGEAEGELNNLRLLCVDGTCRRKRGVGSAEMRFPGRISCDRDDGTGGEVYFCDAGRNHFTLNDPHPEWVCAALTGSLSAENTKRVWEFSEGGQACQSPDKVRREPPSSFPIPHTHGEGQSCGGIVTCRAPTWCNEGNTCEGPRAEGGSCRQLNAKCQEGLHCNIVSGKCEAPAPCRAEFADGNPVEAGTQYVCCSWHFGTCTGASYVCRNCGADKAGPRCIDWDKGQSDIDAECGVH